MTKETIKQMIYMKHSHRWQDETIMYMTCMKQCHRWHTWNNPRNCKSWVETCKSLDIPRVSGTSESLRHQWESETTVRVWDASALRQWVSTPMFCESSGLRRGVSTPMFNPPSSQFTQLAVEGMKLQVDRSRQRLWRHRYPAICSMYGESVGPIHLARHDSQSTCSVIARSRLEASWLAVYIKTSIYLSTWSFEFRRWASVVGHLYVYGLRDVCVCVWTCVCLRMDLRVYAYQLGGWLPQPHFQVVFFMEAHFAVLLSLLNGGTPLVNSGALWHTFNSSVVWGRQTHNLMEQLKCCITWGILGALEQLHHLRHACKCSALTDKTTFTHMYPHIAPHIHR